MLMTYPFHNVLNQYFDRLNESKVRFCVLSGYDGLPDNFGSKDIDILVSKEQLDEASNALKSSFRKNGSEYYSFHRYKGRSTYIFYFLGDDGIVRNTLKIDLFVNFEFRGRIFLASPEIFGDAVPCNNFYIPGTLHLGFMALVKGILKGGSAWGKYNARVQKALREYPDEMKCLLERIFHSNTISFLVLNLSNGNVPEVEKIRKRLIHETYIKSFIRNPIGFPMNLLCYFMVAISKIVNRPNYMIAVLGPDGAGKSTLIRHINNDLMDVLKIESNELKIFHIRPGLFPTITELLRSKGRSKEGLNSVTKVWQSPSRVLSFIRLLCFWFDYILGYAVKILPELGNYNVVILDRYFFDLLIDPSRYKIKLPHGLIEKVLTSLPKPRVIFILDAPAAIIYQRKRELDEARIDSLLKKYRNLQNDFDNVHILRATDPPDVLSREVVSTFVKSAATRLR